MLKKVLLSITISASLFASSAEMSKISPDEAIKMLKEGNDRFIEQKKANPNSEK